MVQTPNLMELMSKLDLGKLSKLAGKVDLPALLETVSSLDEKQLSSVMKMLSGGKGERKAAPAINGDFFDMAGLLTDSQRDVQMRTRAFMEREVHPIINDYWQRDETPRQLIPMIRDLGLIETIWNEDGTRTADATVLEGIITMEMARIDASTCVFFGVHAGLAMASIALGGSEEQKKEWIPKLRSLELTGAFGLTEPDVGSGVAGGITTTCKKDGDRWILGGEKKWIGNATFADLIIIWARDVDEGDVKGFIVRSSNPGYSVKKIVGKIALRAVENGHSTLENCVVEERDRLQNVHGFRTTADVLRLTRVGVAWQGVGCAMGAYELSLEYAGKRQQFGKPIGSFQLIQNHLVHMLGNVTAMQHLCLRLSQLNDAGQMRDEQASLAKVFTAARCRETVALARELHGGNGILLEHNVARFFCDTEAIYSYEGTNEINTLVVGRAITGLSAFV